MIDERVGSGYECSVKSTIGAILRPRMRTAHLTLNVGA